MSVRMTEPFSKRHGYRQPIEVAVTVRQDAPYELRGVLVQLAYDCGFHPSSLRALVCRVLRKRPNPDNWSEYPNVNQEVRDLVDECEWYRVYDITEAIAAKTRETSHHPRPDTFETELNEYFVENGIGWKLHDGALEARGAETFEQTVSVAEGLLVTGGQSTARNELREALHDLSRRPNPDITGAVQHSMAALECVARELSGDEKTTLGEIIRRHRDLIPRPLDEVIAKAWGYASENARHIREGREPTYEEAELIIGLVSSVSTYLARKHQTLTGL